MNKPFLTKDRGDIDTNAAQEVYVKFRPATEQELKALGDDLPDGYVAGWASTSDLDHYRHIVEQNAFSESIAEKGLEGPKGIKLLIQHDANRPAGRIVKLEQRSQGLWIEAQMNLNISYVRDMYEAAKMQGGLSFSVGFFLEEFEYVETEDGYDHLRIIKGELTEVSIVTFPGNDHAQMVMMKTKPNEAVFGNLAEFEKALVASGLAKSRNDAARITQVVKANPALFQPKEPLRSADDTEKLDKALSLLGELKKFDQQTETR